MVVEMEPWPPPRRGSCLLFSSVIGTQDEFGAVLKHQLGNSFVVQNSSNQHEWRSPQLLLVYLVTVINNCNASCRESNHGSESSYHDDTALTSSYSITSEAQFSSSSSGNSIYKSFRRDSLPDHSDQASVSEIATNMKYSHVDLMIGRGSYGTVYKAKFHHTVVAVKVLNSFEDCGTQQLQQELEVLGKIWHPHLLLMLGACPEHGCFGHDQCWAQICAYWYFAAIISVAAGGVQFSILKSEYNELLAGDMTKLLGISHTRKLRPAGDIKCYEFTSFPTLVLFHFEGKECVVVEALKLSYTRAHSRYNFLMEQSDYKTVRCSTMEKKIKTFGRLKECTWLRSIILECVLSFSQLVNIKNLCIPWDPDDGRLLPGNFTLQVLWDPDGLHCSCLGSSRISTGGKCHIFLLEEPWAWLTWTMDCARVWKVEQFTEELSCSDDQVPCERNHLFPELTKDIMEQLRRASSMSITNGDGLSAGLVLYLKIYQGVLLHIWSCLGRLDMHYRSADAAGKVGNKILQVPWDPGRSMHDLNTSVTSSWGQDVIQGGKNVTDWTVDLCCMWAGLGRGPWRKVFGATKQQQQQRKED